jgi:hypothetical protein
VVVVVVAVTEAVEARYAAVMAVAMVVGNLQTPIMRPM